MPEPIPDNASETSSDKSQLPPAAVLPEWLVSAGGVPPTDAETYTRNFLASIFPPEHSHELTTRDLFHVQSLGSGNCVKGSIVGIAPDGLTARVIPLRCGRWTCDHCGPLKKRMWMARLLAGRPERFITLTCAPQTNMTPLEAASELKRTWSRFVDHFRRDNKTCEYAWSLQWHENGWPHLHILQRGDYIPQRDLSSYFAKKMRSPIVDIRRIHNKHQAVTYSTRYIMRNITNTLQVQPAGARIYTSRDWNLEEDKSPNTGAYDDWHWSCVKESPQQALDELIKSHTHTQVFLDVNDTIIIRFDRRDPHLISTEILAPPKPPIRLLWHEPEQDP